MKSAVVQKEPSTSITDIIPEVTTAVGKLAKDHVDKVIDENP